VVLVRISRLYKGVHRVEVIPCSYWHATTEHEVDRVVVDGAEIEIGEGGTVYIEAVMIRVAGRTAEITTPTKTPKT